MVGCATSVGARAPIPRTISYPAPRVGVMIPPTSEPPIGCAMGEEELAPYSAGVSARGPPVTGSPTPYHVGMPCDPLTLELEGDARPPHTTYQYPTPYHVGGVPRMRVLISGCVVLGVGWIVWRVIAR
jgi:hypothetical protein